MIKSSSIQSLLDTVDILDVISNYLEVRRSGASYVCVCPFHNDTNPSMHINTNKQFYHCFSCGAGGDVIKFVKEYEKIGFKDAVERIADITGFVLEYESSQSEYKKNLTLDVLNEAYLMELKNHSHAISYLKNRGISVDDIRHFELGYAPSSNFSLRVLQNHNISLEDALSYGGIKKNDSGYYASFINRITFTIRNDRGRVVGFGGRTLSNEDNIAKYVNSPESAIFRKSNILYLYDKAKDSIYKSGQIIVCEGYMDAIALHKAGLSNAVAVLGVALTPYHLPLIKKPNAKVILCFDNDNAGLKASFKSATLLSQNGINGSVVRLSGAKDPSDILNQSGVNELKKQLDNGIELGRFCIDYILENEDLSSPIAIQNAVAKARAYTKTLGEFAASKYDEYIAKRFNVDKKNITTTKKLEKKPQVVKKQSKIYKDYSELSVIKFLYDNKEFVSIFSMICSSSFFVNSNLLNCVINKKDIEEDEIREFLLDENIVDIETYGGFLRQICFINLKYFQRNYTTLNPLEKGYKQNIFQYLSKHLELHLSKEVTKQVILLINQTLHQTNEILLKNIFEQVQELLQGKK